MKAEKEKIPYGGSKGTADLLGEPQPELINYRSIVDVIKNGIASRKFYILSSPERIPGYKQSRNGQSLECLQQLAEANHWHVTINNETGWFIFTAEELPLAMSFENHFGQLAEWIESSIRVAH